MAAQTAFELQQKVKGNAEGFQDYLNDLYRWENDIKLKDEQMKIQAQNFSTEYVIIFILVRV